MDDVSNSKKKNNIVGKLTVVIIVCAVLILISIVMLVFISKQEKALQGADQAIRLSAQGGFECEYAEAQKLYPLQEGVLKVTENRIAYLTLAGNEVYSATINYANPVCIVKDSMAVVIDVDGYSFTVLSVDGISYTKPTTNNIKSATLSSNGMCAIITSSQDSYGEVIIYDVDGTQVSRWSSYNSGYPLSCCFNADSSKLAVTAINTTGAAYKPYIREFALNDNSNNMIVTDYAIYTIEESDVISSVIYNGDNLFAFSANSIYQVINDNLVVIGSDFGSIINVCKVSNKIYIVYADGINQLEKLAIISDSGNTVYNSPIGSSLNAVNSDSSRYVISIDNRIFVYNRDGSVIADISVDEELLRIGFISNDKLVVVSTNGVHTINY